jgi:large subunit ribosomal protein L18
MATSNRYTVSFRRKREGRTDYKKRLKLLKAEKPRLVIRRSLNNIIAQIIEYSPDGDKVIATVVSKVLDKFGWSLSKTSLPCAYLTGLLLAKKVSSKGVKEAIVDIGLSTSVKGSRLFAAVKGAIDGGLSIPHSADVLPSDDRIKGKHIVDYYKKLDDVKKKKLFSGYLKNSVKVEDLSKIFDDVKQNILKS